jgi:hypothetical protein
VRIVRKSRFAGKPFPVTTFYWWLQSFYFSLFGPATDAGDYFGWQIRKSVFNMQYVVEQAGRMHASAHLSGSILFGAMCIRAICRKN